MLADEGRWHWQVVSHKHGLSRMADGVLACSGRMFVPLVMPQGSACMCVGVCV